jgi:DNA-binding MarR family transcriptional regulator
MPSSDSWTFVTNHGAVLGLIAKHGQITVREIAAQLHITERSVHRIIKDLQEAGYVQSELKGRVNHHRVNDKLKLRARTLRDVAVKDLLGIIK